MASPHGNNDPVRQLERAFALASLVAISGALTGACVALDGSAWEVLGVGFGAMLACAALGQLEIVRLARGQTWMVQRVYRQALADTAPPRVTAERMAEPPEAETEASASAALDGLHHLTEEATGLAEAIEGMNLQAELAARTAARLAQLAVGLGRGAGEAASTVAAMLEAVEQARLVAPGKSEERVLDALLPGVGQLRQHAASMARRAAEFEAATRAQHEFGHALAHAAGLQADSVGRLLSTADHAGNAVAQLREQLARAGLGATAPGTEPRRQSEIVD